MKYHIDAKALEDHIAILGKTGSGKTYTAKSEIAERLLKLTKRVCIVDPTNVWWGLRSTSDGLKAAFPVVVFGGDKADMPLLPNSGKAMAEIVCGTSINAVLVTKLLSVRERTQFFTDFAEELMRKNITPLNLIIDEAHCFMPQGKVLSPQAGAMLAAGNELLSGGRAAGLRVTLLSQRPQKLHKDSLTQAETLVAMRLVAPHDRKAVAEWMKAQADDDKHAESILNSLPGLKTGEGWVWSPALHVLKKVQFHRITTYDSSAAPTGKSKKVVLAKVDMKAIGNKLQEYAKEAEENDPQKLKQRVYSLQKELKATQAGHESGKGRTAEFNNKELQKQRTEGFNLGVQDTSLRYAKALGAVSDGMQALTKSMISIQQQLEKVINLPRPPKAGPDETPLDRSVRAQKNALLRRGIEVIPVTTKDQAYKSGKMQLVAQREPTKQTHYEVEGGIVLSKSERKIIQVLFQYQGGKKKNEVAVLSGYAQSGSFSNALSGLRTKGLMESSGDKLVITDDGIIYAKNTGVEPLPTGDALLQHWYGELGQCERKLLEALVSAYPQECDKEYLANETGYQISGSFSNALSRLRVLGLMTGSRMLRASDSLFDNAEAA